jgi:hypothetical protein
LIKTCILNWRNVSRIVYIRGEHNWIEFKKAGNNKIVIIDPWPSGGRKIYSKKPYKNRIGVPLTTFPEVSITDKENVSSEK